LQFWNPPDKRADMLARTFARTATTRFGTRALATRVPIVGGNWKCNPKTPEEVPALIDNIKPATRAAARFTFALRRCTSASFRAS